MASPKKSVAPAPGGLVKLYLFAYNAAQVLGWSYMLYQLINFYIIKSPEVHVHENLWSYVKWTVIIFQNAAVFEILNAACGFVKSNVVITTFQVLSRVMVVVGVVMATPEGKVSPGLPLALLAWSVTEIIRYGYYALNIVNAVPHFVVFLRYTTFIALYPIGKLQVIQQITLANSYLFPGVTGELLCFYWAQSYAHKNTVWSIEMPNAWNATFSYFYFLWFVMLLYIPLFPQMYLHMFAQRRKILGGSPACKKTH